MQKLLTVLVLLFLACGKKNSTAPIPPPPPPPPPPINLMYGEWRGKLIANFGRDSIILFISKDSTIFTSRGTKYTDRQKAKNVFINDPIITFTLDALTLTGWPDTGITYIRVHTFNLSGTRIANTLDGAVLDFRLNPVGFWAAKKQ